MIHIKYVLYTNNIFMALRIRLAEFLCSLNHKYYPDISMGIMMTF
jgi:hypothetical protein